MGRDYWTMGIPVPCCGVEMSIKEALTGAEIVNGKDDGKAELNI